MDNESKRLAPQPTEWSFWDWLLGGGRDSGGTNG